MRDPAPQTSAARLRPSQPMTAASFFSNRKPTCALRSWNKGHRFSCAENSTTNQPRKLLTPRTRVHIGDALHPLWKIQQRDMDQRRSYRQLHTTHRSPQRAGHLEHCAPPSTTHPHSNRMSAVPLESPFVEASTKVSTCATLTGARLLDQHVSHGTDRETPIFGLLVGFTRGKTGVAIGNNHTTLTM